MAMLILAVLWLPPAAIGQELFAVARLDPARSSVTERRGGVDLVLTLSRPVPYRVAVREAPPQLVLDFRSVDFGAGGALRHGDLGDGWSRLAIDLAGPHVVETAQMRTGAADGSARLEIVLRAGGPAGSVQEKPVMPPVPPAPGGDDDVLRVVLDPGHGGVDPGAVYEGRHEADLVLGFALELREALLRAGGFEVAMTRSDDRFVSLEARIDLARRAGGEVMLSLHADAVSEGIARGVQVYTLAEEASSAASARLAERHDRADLLAGVELSGHDDEVARVLMSIARTETFPRTGALAEAMIASLREAGIRLHKRPREQAAFSVLKAPDIPAVLLEIGFMSSPEELKKLEDPEWRARMQAALVAALARWESEDRARAGLRRR
ncbi:MAG: N-acetylmuramoyl-L-alanine amidase [Tropicimonas sp.]|uniref:N-acetylmuramoyl-L-alanine amidase family protein n=1 Tax=Tropicimonas sp. TaxID=2067044 RepID=UPI003A8C098D